MKYGRFLALVGFVILVVVFVLLNHASLKSGLKKGKIAQVLPINRQTLSIKESTKVLRVIDGDTIEVSLNNKTERIRLIGIDAQETLDKRKPAQCFGKEASNKVREVLTGKTIMLESDPTQGERDEYGRLLRYVFLNDSNFNKFILSKGYAHEYTYNSNPYKYQLEFRKAEGKARENKKGLWADNVCN